MIQKFSLIAAGMALVWSLAMGVAAAQPRQSTADIERRLAAVEAQVAALDEDAAAVATVTDTTEALTARLAAIEATLAEMRRARAATPAAVAEIDELIRRTDTMALDIERIRTEVASMRRPPIAAPETKTPWPQLGGYLQTRYEVQATSDEVESASFLIRRARVELSGAVDDRLSYKASVELSEPALRDAYIDAAFDHGIGVRAGQFKVPLTKSGLTSSRDLAFPDRPLMVGALTYDRDIGAAVHGDLWGKRARYFVGVINGGGQNRTDDNRSPAEVARFYATVVGAPIPYVIGDRDHALGPSLALGVAAIHDLMSVPTTVAGQPFDDDVDADGDTDNIRLVTASADLTFRCGGFELLAEAVLRFADFGSILDAPANQVVATLVGDGDHRFGTYVQATYMIVPDLMVGARFESSDLPLFRPQGRSLTGGAGAAFEDVRALSGLVQLYHGDHRLIGVSYSWSHLGLRGAAGSRNAHTALAELQLVF